MRLHPLAFLALAACSSTTTMAGTPSDAGAPADEAAAPAGPFTLTSTAFAEGEAIPEAHSCNGANTSPPLAWTNAPAAAKSFAIVFNDATTDFLHSVTYDIPRAATELPANVQKQHAPSNGGGAKQTRSYANTYGYAGPCPDAKHTYEFVLYALDVETLDDVTMATPRAAAESTIKAHVVASTKLTGTYTPP